MNAGASEQSTPAWKSAQDKKEIYREEIISDNAIIPEWICGMRVDQESINKSEKGSDVLLRNVPTDF
mgnify:CR=1